MKQIVIKKTVI